MTTHKPFLHTTLRRDLVVALPPDVAADVLHETFGDTHQVLVDDEDPDDILFEITTTDSQKRPDVRLEGSLLRWEGTNTRLLLRAAVIVPEGNVWLQRLSFGVLLTAIAAGLFVLVQRLLLLQFSFENSFFVCSAIGLMGYFFIWSALALNKRIFADHNAKRRWNAQQTMAGLARQIETSLNTSELAQGSVLEENDDLARLLSATPADTSDLSRGIDA